MLPSLKKVITYLRTIFIFSEGLGGPTWAIDFQKWRSLKLISWYRKPRIKIRRNRQHASWNSCDTRTTEITVEDMNSILEKFVIEARKKGGEKYLPMTLYQIVCGVLRELALPISTFWRNLMTDLYEFLTPKWKSWLPMEKWFFSDF